MGKYFCTFAALFAGIMLAGCQTPQPSSQADASGAVSIRDNCYALLHDLLNDEKDIKFLRFIRPERTDIKNLTKQIAATAKTGAAELEDFARQDPSLHLRATALPPGEKATRAAISKTKERELLRLKGEDFELALLMTQSEALNYGRHLAAVAAVYEPSRDRARAMETFSHELATLYDKVFDLELAAGRVAR